MRLGSPVTVIRETYSTSTKMNKKGIHVKDQMGKTAKRSKGVERFRGIYIKLRQRRNKT
jgi:hypothetical protein